MMHNMKIKMYAVIQKIKKLKIVKNVCFIITLNDRFKKYF